MGSRNTTAFTMKLPELSDISNISSGLSVDMTQYIPSKMRPFLKKMVNTAFSQHYRWRLRAELDCKGINFTSRETLYLKEKTI